MEKLYKILLILLILIGIDYSLSKSNFPINSKSYLMGFDRFIKIAEQTVGQKRIVLVGGSSLGWGVSAERLTETLGILTLNSGIHAGVGYRNFIRNIRGVIDRENDLLIISPEYLVGSRDAEFIRSDEFCEIALYVRRTYPFDCIGYSLTKMAKIVGTIDRENGDYRRNGFNRFGDYVHRTPGIDMIDQFSEEDLCFENGIDNLKKEYIPYIKKLEAEGFRFIYIPNFTPSSACNNSAILNDFHNALHRNFGVVSFESPQLLFDEGYFYNSSYHLTDEGVALKTMIFQEQLKSYISQK